MTNKKIAGRKILKETSRRCYRRMQRRNESRESVSEVGRCNKKSRTLTRTGVSNPIFDMVALASRGGNAPLQLNFPDRIKCLPQAQSTSLHDTAPRAVHLAGKNSQPSILNAWSPNSSSSNPRENHVEETCLIDFPSKKESVKDSLTDLLIGFIDEDEMFNMPGLVNSMAEGMLLTPPAMKRGFKWSHDIDQVDDANYINLWG